MNYAALSIDELAALTVTDPGARAYAADNFRRLVVQLEDEWQEQYKEGYDEDVNQAAGAMLAQELERLTPWYDVGPDSEYWRIG